MSGAFTHSMLSAKSTTRYQGINNREPYLKLLIVKETTP